MKTINTMRKIFMILLLSALHAMVFTQASVKGFTMETELLPGENWWGGNIVDGRKMPFGSNDYSVDQNGNLGTNQSQPLFVSDKGRFIWSEEPCGSASAMVRSRLNPPPW